MIAGMIICPRCRKPMEADHECAGLTRRHLFLGLFAGAAAGMALGDVWGASEPIVNGMDLPFGGLVYRPDGGPVNIHHAFYGGLIAAGKSVILPPDKHYHCWRAGCDSLWPAFLLVRNPRVPFWKRPKLTA